MRSISLWLRVCVRVRFRQRAANPSQHYTRPFRPWVNETRRFWGGGGRERRRTKKTNQVLGQFAGAPRDRAIIIRSYTHTHTQTRSHRCNTIYYLICLRSIVNIATSNWETENIILRLQYILQVIYIQPYNVQMFKSKSRKYFDCIQNRIDNLQLKNVSKQYFTEK